jgi:hypothetical protein
MFVSVYLFKLSCLSILEYIFCTVLHRECRPLIKSALLLIDFILRTLIGSTKTTVPAPIAERDSTFESFFLEGLSRLMTGLLPGLKAMSQRLNEGRHAHASGKGHTLVRGLTVLQTALTYGKKLLKCAVKISKVYVQTPINAILTNQRNHNS